MSAPDRCPVCASPAPHLHPAMHFEGEVEFCCDAFHLRPTNQNRPEYIAGVLTKRATLAPCGRSPEGNETLGSAREHAVTAEQAGAQTPTPSEAA